MIAGNPLHGFQNSASVEILSDAGPEKTFYRQGQDKQQMAAIVIV
jgi:hypothetical protein